MKEFQTDPLPSGDDFSRGFEFVSETRRRWSDAENAAIVADASAPCTNVSAVARRHGIKPPLLFRWLKERTGGPLPANAASFVPVVFPEAGPLPSICATKILPPSTPIPTGVSTATEMIEIELQNGRRVRVGSRVDLAALKQIIAILEA
ncbi:MAG: IS66-like element accessory protein TnpA [Gemmatimonadales bacterium]